MGIITTPKKKKKEKKTLNMTSKANEKKTYTKPHMPLLGSYRVQGPPKSSICPKDLLCPKIFNHTI